MKGRETTKTASKADLLLCFPSRANLALRPKPICGPGMTLDAGNCRRSEQRPHLKRSITRGGQASPLIWAKPKQMGSDISEPTSPKVTCSGQIKVRPRTRPCKSWQSVMEEIERIHHSSKKHKRPSWLDSFGVIKKDVMQFLTCLRSLRFDLQCFGTSPISEVGTDNEEEDERYDEGAAEENFDESTSRAIFSKWFMVLQENQDCELYRKDRPYGGKSCDDAPVAPPPNALLLMRCRSAPVKEWSVPDVNEEEEERDCENTEDQDSSESSGTEVGVRKLGFLMNLERLREEDEERRRRMAGVSVNSYNNTGTERPVISRRIDPFSRSRSWKR